MTYEQLLASIRAWAGMTDDAQTEAVTTAVVGTLSEMIAPARIDKVIDALPRQLANLLRQPATAITEFDQDAFFLRVAQNEGTNAGFAREHAPVVVHAIADSLVDGQARQQFLTALPPWLADRVRHVAQHHAPRPPKPSHRKQTLANGAGGSSHPVAVSRAARAHTHSIARNPTPHGDTKIATGEVHDEDPVADTPPGSHHPLVE